MYAMHASRVGQHLNLLPNFKLRKRCHYPTIPTGMRAITPYQNLLKKWTYHLCAVNHWYRTWYHWFCYCIQIHSNMNPSLPGKLFLFQIHNCWNINTSSYKTDTRPQLVELVYNNHCPLCLQHVWNDTKIKHEANLDLMAVVTLLHSTYNNGKLHCNISHVILLNCMLLAVLRLDSILCF